jgi:hypothetical protein
MSGAKFAKLAILSRVGGLKVDFCGGGTHSHWALGELGTQSHWALGHWALGHLSTRSPGHSVARALSHRALGRTILLSNKNKAIKLWWSYDNNGYYHRF